MGTRRGTLVWIFSLLAACGRDEAPPPAAPPTVPIDGVAGLSKAQIGDLAGPTTELTTVSQLDPVRVRFPISEREYLEVRQRSARTGQTAGQMFFFSLVLADESVWNQPGTLLAANQEIGKETGTLLVDVSFPNPGNVLRPGQYARVRAETQERSKAIVVPQRAIAAPPWSPGRRRRASRSDPAA
jgi:membrane fusion protein (multidrug efflux system)